MRMTPLDIQKHRFARRISGYDTEEVDTYLQMAADDCESLTRENETLKDEMRRLEVRVKELAETETVLRQTLVSAQAMSEELRQTAVRESEVLLGEAELRAERILDASHRRAARLGEDVRELRGLRKRLATTLRSTIHTHLAMVDSLDPENAEAEVDLETTRVEVTASTETIVTTQIEKTAAVEAVAGSDRSESSSLAEAVQVEVVQVAVEAQPLLGDEPIVVAERGRSAGSTTRRNRPGPEPPVLGGP